MFFNLFGKAAEGDQIVLSADEESAVEQHGGTVTGKKAVFANLFKKKTSVPGEDAGDDTHDDTPPKKGKAQFFVMVVVLALAAGSVVYVFMDGTHPKHAFVPKDMVRKDSPSVRVVTGAGPISPPQAQNSAQPAPGQPPIVASPVSVPATTLAVQPATPIAQPKTMYIPARDILGEATTKQQQFESDAREREAEAKALKATLDVRKVQADTELLPFQTNAQKRQIAAQGNNANGGVNAGTPAVQRPKEVSQEQIQIPSLTSVQTVGGIPVASLIFPSGEVASARAGQMAGSFKVQEVGHTNVVLQDKSGKTYSVYMKMPDRYPVSSQLFGEKPEAAAGAAQQGGSQQRNAQPAYPYAGMQR